MKQPTGLFRLMNPFLNNIQITLIVVGMLVVVFGPQLFGHHDPWYVTAVTAIMVGTLNGIILWILHQRQGYARQQAIDEVRLMMQDQIKNQLSIILTSTYLVTRTQDNASYVSRINETVEAISSGLDDLSEESLARWQHHYRIGEQPVPDTKPLGRGPDLNTMSDATAGNRQSWLR